MPVEQRLHLAWRAAAGRQKSRSCDEGKEQVDPCVGRRLCRIPQYDVACSQVQSAGRRQKLLQCRFVGHRHRRQLPVVRGADSKPRCRRWFRIWTSIGTSLCSGLCKLFIGRNPRHGRCKGTGSEGQYRPLRGQKLSPFGHARRGGQWEDDRTNAEQSPRCGGIVGRLLEAHYYRLPRRYAKIPQGRGHHNAVFMKALPSQTPFLVTAEDGNRVRLRFGAGI